MKCLQTILTAAILLSAGVVRANAGAMVPLTLTNTLPANDDGSTSAVSIGIDGSSGVDFFGQMFDTVFVNNNGNLTFGSSLPQYTPNGLATGVGLPIIAPFFADVDTRGAGSQQVTYGNVIVGGMTAFAVDYAGVGYYNSHYDKLNSFQVLLFDRTDTGAGNFDIQFNYDQVQWETGEASGGVSGLGGVSAAAGYSNGLSGTGNIYYQLPGSLVNGALIDGGVDSLIGNDLNSTTLGRYNFAVRNGVVVTLTPEPRTYMFILVGLSAAFMRNRYRSRSSR